MEFTGERPTMESGLDGSRMRYKAVLPYCVDKNILDYGCGIGLGSYMLCKYAKTVHGYDPQEQAVNEACSLFKHPNLTFSTSYKPHLHSANIIIMVEVIEHIEKPDLDLLIKELCRFPADLICTTPNGDVFPYHPMKKEERRGYHVWHYTQKELEDFFGEYYKFTEISGHARDPRMNNFTGYTIYATNNIKWNSKWLTQPIP